MKELHDDLIDYLETGDSFPMLRHPLVYAVPYTEEMNESYNEQYKVKKAHAEKCYQDRNINGYLCIHERPYRLEAFIFYIAGGVVSDTDYWESLGWIFTDSENIHANYDAWLDLLSSDRAERHLMMDTEERDRLATGLPDDFTIWRGFDERYPDNWLSWTLDRQKAEWFAKRFRGDGKVAKAIVNKADVIAYFNNRREQEIVVVRSKLGKVTII